MATKVFSNARAHHALTVLAAAGTLAGLTACSSNEATYRPAPRYTNGSSAGQKSCGGTPVYTPPSSTTQPSQPQPVTQPPKPSGGSGCGGGKCG